MVTKYLLSLAALWAGATSVLGQDQTIFEIANTNPDLSILATALTLTDLDEVLDCTSALCRYFTVFAPNNDAFNALPAAVLNALTTNPEFETHLKYILLYHVTLGRIRAESIEDGDERFTLYLETIKANVTDSGDVFINQAKVITPDVEASNGIAHVIDAVLLPSFMEDNIIGIAEKAGKFNTLLAALSAANLTSALEGTGPFTVFAPTDDAFDKLGSAVVNDLLLDIPALTNILTYHVIPDKIITISELEAGRVTTLQGEDITISFRGFWFSSHPALNGDVHIEGFDVLASNGVIHVISDVLTPPSSDPPAPTITELAEDTADLSTLVTALEATGLNETLQTAEGPLTVFAPTNEAFDKLGSETLNGLLQDTAALTNILQYHVVSGDIRRGDLNSGDVVTALNGNDINVHVRGWWFWTRYYLNSGIRIFDFDNEAKNGVVHLIDEVLIPPTDIVATASTGGFPTLVTALEATGLDAALREPGPFTVFAPTEEAFSALGDTLNTLLADNVTLSQILLYHVVPGRVTRGDLERGSVNTLQDETIEVKRNCFLFFCGRYFLNDEVDFVDFDIFASNGIIHSVDEVLIPPSLAGSL